MKILFYVFLIVNLVALASSSDLPNHGSSRNVSMQDLEQKQPLQRTFRDYLIAFEKCSFNYRKNLKDLISVRIRMKAVDLSDDGAKELQYAQWRLIHALLQMTLRIFSVFGPTSFERFKVHHENQLCWANQARYNLIRERHQNLRLIASINNLVNKASFCLSFLAHLKHWAIFSREHGIEMLEQKWTPYFTFRNDID